MTALRADSLRCSGVIAAALAGPPFLPRRCTRLTNAFSKKLENLKATIALHFAHYNFVRIHQTLRITPAMAANLADHLWDLGELLATVRVI